MGSGMDRRKFLKATGAAAAGAAVTGDKLLGMDAKIAREDYVGGAPAAMQRASVPPTRPALAAAEWDGFGGLGDYAMANGNTHAVMTAGHAIRDGVYNPGMLSTAHVDETYDCVVVGGGISGLAAAQTFLEKAGRGKTCLVLENHSVFGGEARRNEFDVNGQRMIAPQGSAMFFPPLAGSSLLKFYESIGFDGKGFQYQPLGAGAEGINVANTSYAGNGKNLGTFFGKMFGHPDGLWVIDANGKKLEGTPFPEKVKQEMMAARQRGGPEVPRPQAMGDEASRALDRMTQEEYMMQREGLSRETIRTYMPNAGSAAGASADVISALADPAPDLMFPWDTRQRSQMFPDGNGGIARFQMKALVPDAIPGPLTLDSMCRTRINFAALDRPGQPVRMRLKATVMAMKHDGDAASAKTVTVGYMHEGRPRHVRAKLVVMAGGWTTARTILDLPQEHREAYRQFHRMPCMVANIALTNWRFLAKQGISECKWYEGLGESFAVRRWPLFGGTPATITPDEPTVITMKIYFTQPGVPLQEQAAEGRIKLLGTPFSEYERQIREQFTLMFARWGFDAKKDIAGIILNRWGHAYLVAQPGFFFGEEGKVAPREVLRRSPFGRIGFANSDLSGIMDHRASIDEAQRAVGQLLG